MKDNKNIMMHLSMLKRVINYLLDPANVSITESIPRFFDTANEVQANINTLDALLVQHAAVITGLAVQKKRIKVALAEMSYIIMSSVRSYALKQNNAVLAAQMKTSLSDLIYIKYSAFTPTIGQALAVVEPLLGLLDNYHVTSAIFTSWQTQYENYLAVVETPQAAIAGRKALGQQIQTTMHETMLIVTGQLDTLASNFKTTYPIYYGIYRANRKLIHTATVAVTPALRIYVKNSLGMAITQGEVIVISTDKSALLDNKGHAFIENIPTGPQMISVTTPYAPATQYGPVNFVEGRIQEENIQINSPADDERTLPVMKEKVVNIG